MRKKTHGFTLVEAIMVSALLICIFIGLDSVLVMVVKKSLVNNYNEEAQMLCQRAALEINGYGTMAAAVELIGTNGYLGSYAVTTNPANIVAMLDRYGNTNATFSYTAGATSNTGSLSITPYITNVAQAPFVYCAQVSVPNGNAFWWTNGGFVVYSFACCASTNTVNYQGAIKPPQ